MLACLVDTCLGCIVEDVVLTGRRRGFGKCLVRLFLLPLHHVEVGGERGEDLGHADAVHAQVLEQGRECGERVSLTDLLQFAEEHQHALVGAAVQRLGELLHVKPDGLCYLLRLLEQHHDEARHCRCRHLHLLTVSVKGGGEGKDFGDCHSRLCAHTSHALGELHKVGFRRGTVLREDIHRGADSEHCVFGAEYLLDTEDVGELGDDLGRSLAQVHQCHIDDVGCLDIALNTFPGVLAQASCFLRQLVELVSPGTCVHRLE